MSRSLKKPISALAWMVLILSACAVPSEEVAGERVLSSQQALGTAIANGWTWLDVAGTQCGNGTQTGIGINMAPGNNPNAELMVYMAGGSACWDKYTCWDIGLAAYFTSGFNQSTFTSSVLNTNPLDIGSGADLWDRNNPKNPYRNANFVYIPYCTGDVHVGYGHQTYSGSGTGHSGRPGVPASLEAYFKGGANFDAILARIKAADAFPNPSRITMVGVSAGGFGATINSWKMRKPEYYPNTRVDVVSDSGPIFDQRVPTLANLLSKVTYTGAWDGAASIPPGCQAKPGTPAPGETCAEDYSNAYPYFNWKYPDSKLGFVEWTQDLVMSGLYFNATLDPFLPFVDISPSFYDRLKTTFDTRIKPTDRVKAFIPAPIHFASASGTLFGIFPYSLSTSIPVEHTMLQWMKNLNATGDVTLADGSTVSDTVNLSDWLTAMHDDKPEWRNVTAQETIACSPTRCSGQVCGDDGCGGSCGSCGAGTACNQAQTQCVSGCNIDGVFYAAGARDSLFGCNACVPATSTSSWTQQSSCTTIPVAVTDAYMGGAFGGLSAANTKCANNAASAGYGSLPGTWKAIISTSSSPVSNLISSANGTRPVVNLLGQQMFPSWNSIFTNQVWPTGLYFYQFSSVNEWGWTANVPFTGSQARIWTGSNTNGAVTSNTCSNWTNWPFLNGSVGNFNANKFLNAGYVIGCADPNNMSYLGCALVPN